MPCFIFVCFWNLRWKLFCWIVGQLLHSGPFGHWLFPAFFFLTQYFKVWFACKTGAHLKLVRLLSFVQTSANSSLSLEIIDRSHIPGISTHFYVVCSSSITPLSSRHMIICFLLLQMRLAFDHFIFRPCSLTEHGNTRVLDTTLS